MDSWNPDDPLARTKGESAKANQGLLDYALMGPGRSLAKLADWYNGRGQSVGKLGAGSGGWVTQSAPPTKRLATLEAWSARFDWQARVGRWQALENAKEREKWEQRRTEWRERSYDLAGQLAAKAEQMLKFPLVERVVDDTGATIIQPAGWTFGSIPVMASVADKLARQAADLDTEMVSYLNKLMEKLDINKLAPQQLDRIISGEHPLAVILGDYLAD